MDMDTDWEMIKDTQLSYLIENKTNIVLGADHRYAGVADKGKDPAPGAVDPRDNVLRGLVNVASFN